MPLKLYNTYAKKEEEFVPLRPPAVTMYTCGPTVYGRPHIGNYSSFLMADLLRRWLEVSGYTVKHAKNITDVGHLVADAETGEDKVEKEAKRIAQAERGKDAQVTMDDVLGVARMYTEQYLADEKSLNILEPTHRPKATETIPEMITTIQELIAKGHAYEADDGIYFAVESFPKYGKLSGNTLENLDAGSRVQVKEDKRHPADFALWKKCVGSNASHILRWDSPWGPGFPGWHIECSCMSTKFLGAQIDVHTGGEDNIFPHHECEIAQSECMSGVQFVRYWLHKRRIDMGKEKMSKSLGNVLTLSDIEAMGYSPLDLRYYFLSVHYRTQLKFAEKGLDDARKARRKIVEWMQEVQDQWFAEQEDHLKAEDMAPWVREFTAAMDADLNTPAALAALFACMAWSRNQSHWSLEALGALRSFIDQVQKTFGCFAPEAQQDIPAEVQRLVEKRMSARTAKDFTLADTLRGQIQTLGYDVRDLPDGKQHVSVRE